MRLIGLPPILELAPASQAATRSQAESPPRPPEVPSRLTSRQTAFFLLAFFLPCGHLRRASDGQFPAGRISVESSLPVGQEPAASPAGLPSPKRFPTYQVCAVQPDSMQPLRTEAMEFPRKHSCPLRNVPASSRSRENSGPAKTALDQRPDQTFPPKRGPTASWVLPHLQTETCRCHSACFDPEPSPAVTALLALLLQRRSQSRVQQMRSCEEQEQIPCQDALKRVRTFSGIELHLPVTGTSPLSRLNSSQVLSGRLKFSTRRRNRIQIWESSCLFSGLE